MSKFVAVFGGSSLRWGSPKWRRACADAVGSDKVVSVLSAAELFLFATLCSPATLSDGGNFEEA